jgi:hypothetical protein
MFDQKLIQQQLNHWLINFVEQPNPVLGNWAPCPYARQARITNQIEIRFSEIKDLWNTVKDSLVLLEQKEVIVVCFDHTDISAVSMQIFATMANEILMPKHVLLEDHPGLVEHVGGIKMNFGHCGLLIVQNLEKLNTASKQLQSKGYYDHWDQTALDQVVTWRNNK